jgi:hypothetical protein
MTTCTPTTHRRRHRRRRHCTPACTPDVTVRDINSDSNPTFKLLRLVLAARGVRKHHRALLAGTRASSR